MSSLADMVRVVLDIYADKHADELARSEKWCQVRDSYKQLVM